MFDVRKILRYKHKGEKIINFGNYLQQTIDKIKKLLMGMAKSRSRISEHGTVYTHKVSYNFTFRIQ
jgi:methyl coenzyme M reductase subunit D